MILSVAPEAAAMVSNWKVGYEIKYSTNTSELYRPAFARIYLISSIRFSVRGLCLDKEKQPISDSLGYIVLISA